MVLSAVYTWACWSYILSSSRYLKLLPKPISPLCVCAEWKWTSWINNNCVSSNCDSVQPKFFDYKLQPAKTFYHAKLFMKMMNHKRVNKICICRIARAAKKLAHTDTHTHTACDVHFRKHRWELCVCECVWCVELFTYIFQVECQL